MIGKVEFLLRESRNNPSAHMTLYMGVEMALRDEIKEFEELQVI